MTQYIRDIPAAISARKDCVFRWVQFQLVQKATTNPEVDYGIEFAHVPNH
jgi:hypothetical protein